MSVGPTRGPVQRPGLDRDLTEIFQRLDDLERVKAGGDWILVERQTANGSGGFDFQDIPQDARNLVLIAAVKVGNGPYPLSLNADGGAHYNAVRSLLEDTGAGAGEAYTSDLATTYIDLLLKQGNAAYTGGVVVTLPGYRFSWSTGNRPRPVDVLTWCSGVQVTSVSDFYRRAEIDAWWNDNPGAAASAITRIQLLGNGAEGEAELYKVM